MDRGGSLAIFCLMARPTVLCRAIFALAATIPTTTVLAQSAAADSTPPACVVPPSRDTVRTYLTVSVMPFDDRQALPSGFLTAMASEIGLQFKVPRPFPLHSYVSYRQKPRQRPEFAVLGVRSMFGLSVQRGQPATARIYASSMSEAMDQAAIDAIKAAVSDPGAPLPAELGNDPIDLRVFFETVDTIHPGVIGIVAMRAERQRFSQVATLQPMEAGPQFPARLREIVDTGFVEAEFVVDQYGQPIPFTFRVAYASERSFARSVLDYLPALQFRPAQIGECAVPMHVRMPFRFSLEP
jgi:hypothetical protein